MNDFYIILLFAVFGITSFALIFIGNVKANHKLKKSGYMLLFLSIVVYVIWFALSIWVWDT